MKSFRGFNVDDETHEIYGIPSGQMIEISNSDLKSLRKMNLVEFISFAEEYFDLDKPTPMYQYCFKDKDYHRIIDILIDLTT